MNYSQLINSLSSVDSLGKAALFFLCNITESRKQKLLNSTININLHVVVLKLIGRNTFLELEIVHFKPKPSFRNPLVIITDPGKDELS